MGTQNPSASSAPAKIHPYADETVYFATHHQKHLLAVEPFSRLQMKVEVIDIDSDQLGTFSGETERPGPIREVLRGKIQLGQRKTPSGRFFLASEGSFLPHPQIGFMRSNYESLLFVDRAESIEVFVEHISTQVVHEEIEADASTDIEQYLMRNRFPSHAQIVRPKGSFTPIFKGIQDRSQLEQAIHTCATHSPDQRAIVLTDLRANFNPTRRIVITETLNKLCDALKSLCPECQSPGYRIVNSIPGLPCKTCGEPSSQSKDVIYECPRCMLTRVQPRPDGVTSISEDECAFCNP